MNQIDITPEFLASQRLSATFPQRLRAKLLPPNENGCILWSGARRMFKNGVDSHGQVWRGVQNPVTKSWTGLIYAHVAIWTITYGPIPEGLQVQHNCPNKHNGLCCNVDHLKLGKPRENSTDMMAQGTANYHVGHRKSPIGELNPAAKITQLQAEEIRAKYTGKIGEQNALAREYETSQATIWKVLAGKTYGYNGVICDGMKNRSERIQTEKLPKTRKTVLSKEQISEIQSRYAAKRGQQMQFAREYNVSQGTIWNVVNHIGY